MGWCRTSAIFSGGQALENCWKLGSQVNQFSTLLAKNGVPMFQYLPLECFIVTNIRLRISRYKETFQFHIMNLCHNESYSFMKKDTIGCREIQWKLLSNRLQQQWNLYRSEIFRRIAECLSTSLGSRCIYLRFRPLFLREFQKQGVSVGNGNDAGKAATLCNILANNRRTRNFSSIIFPQRDGLIQNTQHQLRAQRASCRRPQRSHTRTVWREWYTFPVLC